MSKICVVLHLKPGFSVENAEEELSSLQGKDFFTIEDSNQLFIGGMFPKHVNWDSCTTVTFSKEETVNFDSQWAQFAPNFYEGKAHLPIKDKTLQLIPGEGFGDFSHPTTQLIMEMMEEHVFQKAVIDIGCGSGILSLAAILLGATKAYGVDIDPAAILHAKKNALINNLPAVFSLTYPKRKFDLALMNMTFLEQKSVLQKRKHFPFWITSGILKEQESEYLAFTKSLHWKLLDIRRKENWSGFLLQS
ncbi:MAG: 50S ribosomal protein L11 methyltransferase [Chlamydiota bacterium]